LNGKKEEACLLAVKLDLMQREILRTFSSFLMSERDSLLRDAGITAGEDGGKAFVM
jgi:hypothetical protein